MRRGCRHNTTILRGTGTGFSARARVLIYNRALVPDGEEPSSIMDLLEPQFQGQACIANPLFGTTSMHAAALFEVLGEERARGFFEQFVENGGRIVSSNGEVRRRVAAGDCALGLTDTDDANVALQEGKPVGVVFPDQETMGTLIIPNAVVLIEGGPNPGHCTTIHRLSASARDRAGTGRERRRTDATAPRGRRSRSRPATGIDCVHAGGLLEAGRATGTPQQSLLERLGRHE